MLVCFLFERSSKTRASISNSIFDTIGAGCKSPTNLELFTKTQHNGVFCPNMTVDEVAPNKPVRRFGTEITVVLALSLGASAIYSILSLVESLTAPKGLAGAVQELNSSASPREWLDFSYQLVGLVLGFAPVALVLYLLWTVSTDGDAGQVSPKNCWFRLQIIARASGFKPSIQVARLFKRIRFSRGNRYAWARVVFWRAGIGASRSGGAERSAQLLVGSACSAAVCGSSRFSKKEFIMIGYLFNRFDSMRWAAAKQIWFSAVIRGAYRLYQDSRRFRRQLGYGLSFWLAL
jgi:hypothetical protein